MKKLKRILALCLMLCLIAMLLLTARTRFKSALQLFAETSGNTKLTQTLQNAMYRQMHDRNGEYLTIHYDSTERISAISIHSEAISVLASEMTMTLLDALENFDDSAFGIPIGNLTNSVLLSGKGPLIPLRPIALGHIANEIQSQLESSGINQTLHRILIRFTVAIRYLAPIEQVADTITIDLVVAETLVVGDVPIYRD